MSDLLSIQEYVRAARAGENAAWSIVYHQYYPGLYATALRICNNVPLAQDVVQEAFITAYLKLPQLKDDSAFAGWIKKILVHTCYRASRSNRTNHHLDNVPPERDSWWDDEFNRKLDLLSTQSKLYTVLARLPESLRSALMLRYFSAFQSYEQIAAILCIPKGTVRSRLNQAKLKMTEGWQEHTDSDLTFFRQSEEWNSFYQATFSGLHHRDHHRTRFMNHLQKDVQLVFPGARPNTGRTFFEKMVADDSKFGSWLRPDNVMSCGNISIIEARHFNSREYPHHCPPRSVLVLRRNKKEVNRMSFHPSAQ